MASTAPVLAPSLSSCCSHCHSIAVKMKALDNDNVGNNGVGMVIVVVAASGTILFIPVDCRPPRLVNNRYPIAIPPLSLI